MTPPLFLRLFWRAINSWFADDIPRHGAALAYYTLFALAPVLLVVIWIAGLLFDVESVRAAIVNQIGALVGTQAAQEVRGILQRASEPREGVGATIAGTFALIFATTGSFLEMQAALNKIWRVKPRDDPGFHVGELVRHRLRSLGLVVSVGFLLLVSLAFSAAIAAISSWLSGRVPVWPIVVAVFNQLFSIVVSTTLFALLFMVLPDRHLAWRDVAVGSLTTAIFFTLGQRLIGLYLGHSDIASPFGAAGTIAIMLVWVYYSTQIVLLGAEFTQVYATHRRPAPPPMAFAERDPKRA